QTKMKKLIISSLFMFFAATTVLKAGVTTFTKDDGGSEKIASTVLRHFGYTFYRASDVTWTINKTYQKATFILNGKPTYAIYDLENKFLVATQLVETKELPEKAQAELTTKFVDYKVANVLKVIARPTDYQLQDDTNAYWVDLTSKADHLIAIAFPGSDFNIVKAEKIK
ncbi:MAG: hypothetical protein KJ744_10775, partial [Bacteroidetes bacterium]|nr:hypothetical protein [Bacteroidota bacterium]